MIERVHTKFCKKVLCVKLSTQNDIVYGELGRKTVHTKILFMTVKYWLKIVNSDERKNIKTCTCYYMRTVCITIELIGCRI